MNLIIITAILLFILQVAWLSLGVYCIWTFFHAEGTEAVLKSGLTLISFLLISVLNRLGRLKDHRTN